MRLGVVIPFLNEGRLLADLLASIAAQDRLPDRLVLVDDGSDDGSFEIASAFAAEHAYAVAVRRPRRDAQRDRLAGAHELVAFQWAIAQEGADWDVVAKLDGDLRLPSCAFAEILRHLEEDPGLGLAGSFLTEAGEDGIMRRIHIGRDHVHGATKFYRRACWDQIHPVPPILGWDTIDEVRAQISGWRTQSFALPGGDIEHRRRRGSHDGMLRGYRRWGRCAWAIGDPPLLILAQATRFAGRRPVVLGGVNYVAGWTDAALRRAPRAEPEVRQYLATEQWSRVRARLRGGRRR